MSPTLIPFEPDGADAMRQACAVFPTVERLPRAKGGQVASVSRLCLAGDDWIVEFTSRRQVVMSDLTVARFGIRPGKFLPSDHPAIRDATPWPEDRQ